MAMKKGPGPTEALDPKVVRTLLDRLSTDDDFRGLFESDPHAALVEAGWQRTAGHAAAASLAPADDAALSGGNCMRLTGTLASKEQFQARRGKLEKSLAGVVNYGMPKGFQAEED